MKNLYIILISLIFEIGCGTPSQQTSRISLIFLRSEIPDVAMVKEMKEELFVSQLTDSVEFKGEEYPVIIIDFDNDYLVKFGLSNDDVLEALKNELNIPVLESKKKNEVTYKQKDFEQFYRNKSIDQLMALPIKLKEGDKIIPLSSIAQIRLQVHEDQVYYENEPVYIISFKFIGKNKNELKKILESIDKYGVKHKVVYD